MTSIGSLPNTGYYQLSNPSGGAGNIAATPSLASALAGAASGSAADSNAYLLDLSPEAQKYMSTGAIPTATGNSSFTLSAQQQQDISAIIAKYKDAPYTQDTFNHIQNDLNAAGLGAEQMVRMDQIRNFNPTQLLIDSLSGNYTASDAQTSTAGQEAKSSNYMQQIISQWKTVSTTTDGITPVGSAGGA